MESSACYFKALGPGLGPVPDHATTTLQGELHVVAPEPFLHRSEMAVRLVVDDHVAVVGRHPRDVVASGHAKDRVGIDAVNTCRAQLHRHAVPSVAVRIRPPTRLPASRMTTYPNPRTYSSVSAGPRNRIRRRKAGSGEPALRETLRETRHTSRAALLEEMHRLDLGLAAELQRFSRSAGSPNQPDAGPATVTVRGDARARLSPVQTAPVVPQARPVGMLSATGASVAGCT